MPEDLRLDEFTPRSELVVPETRVDRARFRAIDAHNHLPVTDRRVASLIDWPELIAGLDAVNVSAVVNLSGGYGETLRANLEQLDQAYPGRFYTFCNIDFREALTTGWLDRTLRQLRDDVSAGARGLKVFKRLGLAHRDPDGDLIMPDDPRLFDIWELVGELNVPVLIHTADPTAFFRPLGGHNERWDELHAHPDWHFYGEGYPSFDDLIASLYRLIGAHPNTDFITAHVGCYPENLAFVSEMLDRYPNFCTDISARIAELGRAPYSAREWFVRYQDRILFGTDFRPRPAMYRVHWRFFESDDQYFPYDPQPESGTLANEGRVPFENSDGLSVDFTGHWSPIPTQGRWRIYGLSLPDEVLKKVYHDNAARLLRLG